MENRLANVIAVAAIALVSACEPEHRSFSRGHELYETCMPCHGENGEGNQAVEAPPIGGLSPWYLEAQIHKFRQGKRGYHFDDLAGLRMRPMSLALRDDSDIKEVSTFIAALPRPPKATTIQGGDPKKGEVMFGLCATCHGAKGEGDINKKAPAIAGAADWYLASQIHKFKTKQRGDPTVDPNNEMLAMALTLHNEQAVKDVVAYVLTLPAPSPNDSVKPPPPAAPPAAPTPTPAPAAPTEGHGEKNEGG